MWIYGITIFLSAFLLFQIQLIVARHILPWYGGSASVWTTSLLFFQVILLLGYSYSHILASRFSPGRQARIHLLLSLLTLGIMAILGFRWGSPVLAGESWKPALDSGPVFGILFLLVVSIGLPFLLLSSTSPLLQRWFSWRYSELSPYRLYAVSNLGSLLGLLSYPFLVESSLTLEVQGWVWVVIYVGCVFLTGWTALALLKEHPLETMEKDVATEPKPKLTKLMLWFSLAFCASTLLLATTSQICQEVAVVPLLWVVPLSLYLLSFIICFHKSAWYSRPLFLAALAFGSVLCIDVLSAPLHRPIMTQILVFCFTLFAGCMVCHGELERRKPGHSHLTSFYLMVAAGGAGGGVFTALLAPHLFSGYWEFHLGLALSWLVVLVALLVDRTSFLHRPRTPLNFLWGPVLLVMLGYFVGPVLWRLVGVVVGDSYLYYGLQGIGLIISEAVSPLTSYLPRLTGRNTLFSVAIVAAVLILITSRSTPEPIPGKSRTLWIRLTWAALFLILVDGLANNAGEYLGNSVYLTRSFYGVSKVIEERKLETGPGYSLYHGQTLHGSEFTQYPGLPFTYFGDRSGIGILMVNHPQRNEVPSLRIGVLGLGIGTLASYGRPGDLLRFYEINRDVIDLARGKGGYFNYLKNSRADIEIVEGDARVSLERELETAGPQEYDLLVLDVFSSDSIPVHLLTREAFEVYLAHLSSTGVMALHITNRFVDLKPVIQGAAEEFDLQHALIHDLPNDTSMQESTWLLLSTSESIFNEPPFSLVRSKAMDGVEPLLWTDDFSNLFSVVKF